jgi:hypothetical protein
MPKQFFITQLFYRYNLVLLFSRRIHISLVSKYDFFIDYQITDFQYSITVHRSSPDCFTFMCGEYIYTFYIVENNKNLDVPIKVKETA